MSAGGDFWEFSLSVYAQPGVAEECLSLQARLGVDVNVLLLCAYLGDRRGALLTESDIAAAIAASRTWHANVVLPLRAARISLKHWSEASDRLAPLESAASLRMGVKSLELESERVEQHLLANWAETQTFATTPRERAIRENVTRLIRHYAESVGAQPAQADALIAAAIAHPSGRDRL